MQRETWKWVLVLPPLSLTPRGLELEKRPQFSEVPTNSYWCAKAQHPLGFVLEPQVLKVLRTHVENRESHQGVHGFQDLQGSLCVLLLLEPKWASEFANIYIYLNIGHLLRIAQNGRPFSFPFKNV